MMIRRLASADLLDFFGFMNTFSSSLLPSSSPLPPLQFLCLF